MNVSVVIPNHNYGKTLGACLHSVQRQTVEPIEVIVVDDCSTDDSVRIAEAAGATVVRHAVNRGVSAARNTGVAASNGDVVFFVDSDVALAPDAIEQAVRILAEEPDCGCVFGVYGPEPLIDDGPVERHRVLHLHFVLTRQVGRTETAVFALAAMPRRVFDEIGGFDERLRSAEDDEYSERLRTRYQIRLTDTMVGYHDEVDRLPDALHEQYRRAQLIPFSARNRMRRGGLAVNRTTGVAVVALMLATLPLGLLNPVLLAVPGALLAAFAVADPPLARFVVRRKGLAYLAYFTGVNLLLHIALLAGCARGLLRILTDPTFGPSRRFTIGTTP
ncbi:glycosyltransferase family 2 protein [Dactylosporangium sp. NPDC048998]|uniref:glycosyltransferase family 2 protein n=1 Tax=Dactylosporangium sp. NPDC048998 TaxID=3363976 RepID=UPI003715115E